MTHSPPGLMPGAASPNAGCDDGDPLLSWSARPTVPRDGTVLTWDQLLTEYLVRSYDHCMTRNVPSRLLAAVKGVLRSLSRLMSRSFTSGAGTLTPTSAQGTGTAGGSLGCRTPHKTQRSLRRRHSRCTCNNHKNWRCETSSSNRRHSWGRGQRVTARSCERA